MKSVHLIICLFLLPFATIAREKKVYPNPCDSLQGVVEISSAIPQAQLADHIAGVLKTYKSNKADQVIAERINDSTVVGTLILFVEKITRYKEDDVFGEYIIPHYSDGKIAAKFVFNTKDGKYRFEFYDLNHLDCSNKYGNLCDQNKDLSDKILRGLKIQFFRHTRQINQLIKRAATANSW